MSTHEPVADRDGISAPTGVDSPSRSAAVSGGAGAADGAADGAVGHAADDAGGGAAGDAGGGAAGGVRQRFGPLARELPLLLGVCLVVVLLVNAFVARPFAVPSASMENTLRPGDRLGVNLLAYDFGGHIRRGDIVVFDGRGSFLPYAEEPSGLSSLMARLGLANTGESVYVKRVIGVGGDRVTCCAADGRIRINGVALDESAYLHPGDAPSEAAFDIVVPAGKLWVMGDHRSDSRDSRDHLGEPGGGFVPERKVIGRADWVLFPIGHGTTLARPTAFAVIGGTFGHGE